MNDITANLPLLAIAICFMLMPPGVGQHACVMTGHAEMVEDPDPQCNAAACFTRFTIGICDAAVAHSTC